LVANTFVLLGGGATFGERRNDGNVSRHLENVSRTTTFRNVARWTEFVVTDTLVFVAAIVGDGDQLVSVGTEWGSWAVLRVTCADIVDATGRCVNDCQRFAHVAGWPFDWWTHCLVAHTFVFWAACATADWHLLKSDSARFKRNFARFWLANTLLNLTTSTCVDNLENFAMFTNWILVVRTA
jgi:hypothetical protein